MSTKTENNTKQDVRVTKTQKALSSAMLRILKTTSFNKITVNDLCDLAMVSRTSFYAHFEDKYHLLKFSLRQIGLELINEIKSSPMDHDEPDPEYMMAMLLTYIYENPSLFKNLLFEDVNFELHNMLESFLIKGIENKLIQLEETGVVFKTPVSVLSIFLTGGITKLFMWWIQSGFAISKEELAGFMVNILNYKEDEIKVLNVLKKSM